MVRLGAAVVVAMVAVAAVALVGLGAAPLEAQGTPGSVVRQTAVTPETRHGLVGRVVHAETGAPVAGAEVRVRGRSLATVTGPEGAWRLSGLSAGALTLQVTHIGYGSTAVTVGVPSDAALRVELTPRTIPLGALVVTGSRRAQRLADVPVTTELVTRAEVERTGASDLAAVLTEQTGVQLQGGHPAGAGVMLQGLSAERVLVLVDGQPYVGRISGTIDLSRIPTAAVERVEVVKGPQSTLYGSEAMGGVVNVITREAPPESWRGVLSATGGSDGRMEGHAELAGEVGAVSLLGNVGHRRIDVMPGRASTAGALASRWDGLVKAGLDLGEAVSLSGTLMLLDEDQRWRTGQLWQFADNRQWSAQLGAEWRIGAHRLSPGLYATRFDHLSRRGTAEQPPAESTGSRQLQSLQEAELLYAFEGGAVDVDAGLEVSRESIDAERVAGRARDRLGVEPYVQLTTSIGPVTVVPGIRASWHDAWGTHWTPRLAALWRPVPALAIRASVGRGYRAPAFKELYMQFLNVGPGFGYVVRGNPGLEPETSSNVTAGIEWAGARGFVRGQLFHNRFDAFIETRLAGDSSGLALYTYDNVDEGVTEGVEAEGGVRFGGFGAEAGYSWLHAEDRATGQPLLGRPEHSARVALTQRLPFGADASLTGRYTGETPLLREEDGSVTKREPFLRFDLRLSAELGAGVRLSAGVDNLLDAVPESWPGYSGRQLYLTATMETLGLGLRQP